MNHWIPLTKVKDSVTEVYQQPRQIENTTPLLHTKTIKVNSIKILKGNNSHSDTAFVQKKAKK